MDQLWFVGALWSLVGLAAIVIATWVGGGLRDEILKLKEFGRRSKAFQLIRGGKLTVPERPRLQVNSPGLYAVRVGRRLDRAASSRP
jgi:hypothetical protein